MASVEVPKPLRPFACHGVEFVGDSGDELYGSCPFCLDPQHLYVNTSTAQWQCKKCGESGNTWSFLKKYHGAMLRNTTLRDYTKLCTLRPGLSPRICKRYQLAWTGSEWLLPCITEDGKYKDLRRWVPKGKRGTRATSGVHLYLFGAEQLAKLPKGKGVVWICEGEWDALALQELLLQVKKMDQVAVAVPGADVFKREWTDLFNGREVRLCYDADEAGDRGSRKAGELLKQQAKPLRYLSWPESRPTGWDVRDYITQSGESPLKTYQGLTKLLTPTHRRQEPGDTTPLATEQGALPEPAFEVLSPEERPTFADVLGVFSKWLRMDDDMVECLRFVLAVILSEELPGPPLWAYVIGPPGCGKSQILMSTATSDHTVMRSSVTPNSLISGYNQGPESSLLFQAHRKTLGCKDATEIFKQVSWQRDNVMSILRGAYDGYVARNWGNNKKVEYYIHFTLIMCTTNITHGFSDASLGERFLKFCFRAPSDQAIEDRMTAACRVVATEDRMESELNEVCRRFLARPKPSSAPAVPAWVADELVPLCRLISFLRASVERKNDYHEDAELSYRPEAEYGTRLVKQCLKLAMAQALVDGRMEITRADMDRVRRVALDTAAQFHWDIVRALVDLGGVGFARDIETASRLPEATCRRRLADLILLGIINKVRLTGEEQVQARKARKYTSGGKPQQWHYLLSERVVALLQRCGLMLPEEEGSGGPAPPAGQRRQEARGCRVRRRTRPPGRRGYR